MSQLSYLLFLLLNKLSFFCSSITRYFSLTTNACNRLLPTRFISIFAALINRIKTYIGKCLSVVFNVINKIKKKNFLLITFLSVISVLSRCVLFNRIFYTLYKITSMHEIFIMYLRK